MDWTLDPMDIYKTGPSSVKCYECKQYGHTAYDCQQPYKPIVCIMCGLEGHHFDTCRKKICLSVSCVFYFDQRKTRSVSSKNTVFNYYNYVSSLILFGSTFQ